MSANLSKTLALAGVVQAAKQVQNIARHDSIDDDALKLSMQSLFTFESEDIESIYSNDNNQLFDLRMGLQQLVQMLNTGSNDPINRECWRYSLLLVQLAKKLQEDVSRSRRLGQLLHSFHSQHLSYDKNDEYFTELATVYQQVLSKMSPQIMIHGEHGYLQKTNNPEKVRCLLLSGIRSSFLWWQLGGTRWQFVMPGVRKGYVNEAQRIMNG